MSYSRDIQVGKKVTVNVAEISPTGTEDGYFANSLVINSMPNSDITREIKLKTLCFDVVINFVYGDNDANVGQPFTSIYKVNIINPSLYRKIEQNGQRTNLISRTNTNINQYSFKYYDRNLVTVLGDSRYTFEGINGGPVYGYRAANLGNNIINIQNTAPSDVPLVYNIPVYKVVYTAVSYKYKDNNNQDVYAYPYKAREINSEDGFESNPSDPSPAAASNYYIVGHTYQFTFRVNGVDIVKTGTIQPTSSTMTYQLIFEE